MHHFTLFVLFLAPAALALPTQLHRRVDDDPTPNGPQEGWISDHVPELATGAAGAGIAVGTGLGATAGLATVGALGFGAGALAAAPVLIPAAVVAGLGAGAAHLIKKAVHHHHHHHQDDTVPVTSGKVTSSHFNNNPNLSNTISQQQFDNEEARFNTASHARRNPSAQTIRGDEQDRAQRVTRVQVSVGSGGQQFAGVPPQVFSRRFEGSTGSDMAPESGNAAAQEDTGKVDSEEAQELDE